MVRPKRIIHTEEEVQNIVKPAGEISDIENLKSDPQVIEDSYLHVFNEVEDYAIILLDRTGNIKTWNRGAEKIKGYQAEEIVGKNYRIFYTKEEKEQNLAEKMLAEAEKNRKTNYEGWQVRKDGKRFWASITLTALHHHNDNSIKGFLKVTRDLTEKKIAEDSQSNFLEELKMKNEELIRSEERYHKMIAEVVDYAIILLDEKGKILDWNKGAEKLKGYSAEEIIGKSFRLFYPKEDKQAKLPERLLALAARNGTVSNEGWRVKKDGQRFWASVVITALHNDDDDIIGFSKVTRDLTERKHAEDKVSNLLEELHQTNEQLKISEERYHKMIEEVQDYAIILLNLDGYVENWNTGAQVIKGYRPNEIIGRSFKIFYPPEEQRNGTPERLLGEARTHGRVAHEGWRVRKDGTRFWGSVVITALHNAAGDLIGYSKVTRDLTERKKAEDALKASAAQLDLKNKALQQVNEDLSSFTYVASHDMKEPLRKIKIFAARIQEMGLLPGKGQEHVTKIIDSASRMQNFIEDLLSYSHVTKAEIENFEQVDLNAIVREVKRDLEVPIAERDAVIEADSLPVVMGISFQLHQLFLNLLSNSIKFSKPDVQPLISISSERIQSPQIPGAQNNEEIFYHHITVKDNGIGFDPEHSNKIFEAFQRLHSKRTFVGSGIGLAIVKKVVENHYGIISAEGIKGEGATFHLYLPIS